MPNSRYLLPCKGSRFIITKGSRIHISSSLICWLSIPGSSKCERLGEISSCWSALMVPESHQTIYPTFYRTDPSIVVVPSPFRGYNNTRVLVFRQCILLSVFNSIASQIAQFRSILHHLATNSIGKCRDVELPDRDSNSVWRY